MTRQPAPTLATLSAPRWRSAGSPALLPRLDQALGVLVRGALPPERCADWSRRVLRARRHWVRDFGGEQFALGRAFYTHLETDQAKLYFDDAPASDARVERALPGMQAWTRALFAELTGGLVRPRLGFCGPGVHVFPSGGQVATKGGVIHFDVEGLSPIVLDRGLRTASLVVMLQTPERGGGLHLYGATYRGRENATRADLASPRRLVGYRNGDALLMSSYRLHQIRPFRGDLDRVSITLHAAEVDRGVWETWF